MRYLLLLLTLFIAGCGQVTDTFDIVDPVELGADIKEVVSRELPITSKHYRDIIKDVTKPKERTRTVGKNINYRGANGEWKKSELVVTNQATAPTDWLSQKVEYDKDSKEFTTTTYSYDFDKASLKSPLQFFTRDALANDDEPMVGFRLSDDPDSSVQLRAGNIENYVSATEIDSQTIQWTGLWTDANYRARHTNGGVKTDFVITGENHPASFTEKIKLNKGLTLVDNGDNSLSVMKGDKEVYYFPAPYGFVDGDVLLENLIEVTMVKGAKSGEFETIIITPNADDLAGVGYKNNIIIDPTATISGTSDIDDSLLYSSVGGNNYGALSEQAFQPGVLGGGIRRNVIRVTTSSIPYGTITEVRTVFTREAYAGQNQTGTLVGYYLLSANVGWVEGTKTGSPELNTVCWNDHTYNSIQEWAGSVGAGTSGTDYNATAIFSAPYGIYNAGGNIEFIATSTNNQIWENWRDGVTSSAGILWKSESEVNNDIFLADLSEGIPR